MGEERGERRKRGRGKKKVMVQFEEGNSNSNKCSIYMKKGESVRWFTTLCFSLASFQPVFELSTGLVVPDPLLLGNTVGHSTGYVPSPTWSAHRFGSCIFFSLEAEAVNQHIFFSAAMPLCVVSLSP